MKSTGWNGDPSLARRAYRGAVALRWSIQAHALTATPGDPIALLAEFVTACAREIDND